MAAVLAALGLAVRFIENHLQCCGLFTRSKTGADVEIETSAARNARLEMAAHYPPGHGRRARPR
jgi:hypothetical protein